MKQPTKSELLDKRPPSKSKKGRDKEEQDEENAGVKTVRAGLKFRWERRHGSSSATMCQVCNIQLNSSAQAQIHYRGKTHQRRLRRLAKAVRAGCTGLGFFCCFSAKKNKFIHLKLVTFVKVRPLRPQLSQRKLRKFKKLSPLLTERPSVCKKKKNSEGSFMLYTHF